MGWALINLFCLYDGCLLASWALTRGWALIRINTVISRIFLAVIV